MLQSCISTPHTPPPFPQHSIRAWCLIGHRNYSFYLATSAAHSNYHSRRGISWPISENSWVRATFGITFPLSDHKFLIYIHRLGKSKFRRSCSTHEADNNSWTVLTRNTEGKRPVWEHRRKRQNNIKRYILGCFGLHSAVSDLNNWQLLY